MQFGCPDFPFIDRPDLPPFIGRRAAVVGCEPGQSVVRGGATAWSRAHHKTRIFKIDDGCADEAQADAEGA
jgi:hypothetical protein